MTKPSRPGRKRFIAFSIMAPTCLLIGCNLLVGVDFEDKGARDAPSVNPDGTPGAIPDGGFLPPIAPVEGQCVNERKLCPDNICRDARDPRNGCGGTDCTACPNAADVCYLDTCTTPCVGDACLTRMVSLDGIEPCALRMTGDIVCWPPGTAAPPSGNDFDALALSISYGSCARKRDGTLRCWGNTSKKNPAVPVVAPDGVFTAFATGYHSCGLRSGIVTCWSDDTNEIPQALGPGPWNELAVAGISVCVASAAGAIKCTPNSQSAAPAFGRGLTGGQSAMCALDEASKPVCWDYNTRFLTVDVPMKAVAGALTLACGIRQSDSGLQCWPLEAEGAEATVLNPPAGKYRQVAVGDASACAINEANKLICWGVPGFAEPPP